MTTMASKYRALLLAGAMLAAGAPTPLMATHNVEGVPLIGDPAAGQVKAAMCFGCHGAEGISSNPQFPNLRGQKDVYLSKQIKYFRHNLRIDPTMSAMAQSLTDEEINDIAAFFYDLGQRPLAAVPAMTVPDDSPVGDAKAGRKAAQVCAACHGTDGVSVQRNYPNLRGQQRGYLVKELRAFRNGPRKDPIMTPMLAALSEEDVVNIATYFASLGAPAKPKEPEAIPGD
jgi:cytochrome c553